MKFFSAVEAIVSQRVDPEEHKRTLPEYNAEVDTAVVSKASVLVLSRSPMSNEVVSQHLEQHETRQS